MLEENRGKKTSMDNKIKSIKERLPQVATLDDGYYNGIWGGNVIVVEHQKRTFELETEEGIRGIGVKVIVLVKDGVATFEEINNG